MKIILDGEITPRGRGAAWLRDQLADHTGDVELHVNSPGGDVHEGVALMNVLRAHPGRITAIVEGLAASAASFIVAGGADRVIMRPHSEVMVHSPWMALEGDAPSLEKGARDLHRLGGTLARIYADKAGGTPEHWADVMAAETWYTADEAVAAGLADEVVDARSDTTKVRNVDASPVLARFRYRSRAEAPNPNTKGNTMAEQQSEQSADGVTMTNDQWGTLCTLLDLDTTSATVEEALDLIAAMVDKLASDDQGNDGDGGAVLARSRRVLLDRDTYQELVAGAREGIAIRAQRDAKAREDEVDTWIKEGRINSALRRQAVAMAHRDITTARAFYGSNPPNTIPVKEIGHALYNDDADEAVPSNWVR
ncbi:ATP-dependent Clp protease proteolytic subunit [Corynebacterium freneyi]|uniref:head maturation protease, ClpP-related n=1 Tax=Corynebacterium freneyi TaxID=134034 RepID=UPI0025505011|nr:head maturation protease, ClpP-related [Corynebacterium freneyi]MDK8768227.1 ATP-dependent Clp protease proteolytic subunit [Corynebacterium freneyi]